jgi:hypothetical protein
LGEERICGGVAGGGKKAGPQQDSRIAVKHASRNPASPFDGMTKFGGFCRFSLCGTPFDGPFTALLVWKPRQYPMFFT